MSVKGVCFVCLKNNSVELKQGSWEFIQKEVANHFRDKQAGTFVMMHHCTWLGIYKNGKFCIPHSNPLDPKYLRFVRIFDEDSECYIWRNSDDSSNIFRLRIRKDEEDKSEKPNAVEARQLLWGTRLEDSLAGTHWKVLKEDRGIEILIHEDLLPSNIQVSSQNRLWLITRNYIDYTELGQAGYVDSRFVRIIGEEDEMYEKRDY